MAIGRRPNGSFSVYVYDPLHGNKRYFGTRATWEEAKALESEAERDDECPQTGLGGTDGS